MAERPTSPAIVIGELGQVQLWTTQLAPVNAVNALMLDALESALDAAEADENFATRYASGAPR